MDISNLGNCSFDDAIEFFKDTVGAILYVDGDADEYHALARRDFFSVFLEEKGTYRDLIEKLWYHFNNSSARIDEDYRVFIPTSGKFKGRYSKRLKVVYEEVTRIILMTVYPIKDCSKYLFVLDELDANQYLEETLTTKKVDTIQNTFLFSMYVDLMHDSTSSISISEISDEVVNQQLKYTDWRMMIVNMIWPDDQEQFLKQTDPEYLKTNYTPGATHSFDCQMKNLEGVFKWSKLIFSRAETENPDDYRFVFMVQNIHETTVELMESLKKYEVLALKDPLTSIYNHGRIETEIFNAIDKKSKTNEDIAIMIMDIDFFKSVNDKFGHAAGDSVLVQFARLIKDFCQKRNDVVGRWGGEEFVAVCYNADLNKAQALAEELRKEVEKAEFGSIGHLTCSIGITALRKEDTIETSFERMDKALYSAKSSGRNCVVVN